MTFLPLLWKVFTRVIADEIYSHQEILNFLPPRKDVNENPREQKINYLSTETDKSKYGMDSEDQRLGEVNIRRGIFKVKAGYHLGEGTLVNPLLYMDDLKRYGKMNLNLTNLFRLWEHSVKILEWNCEHQDVHFYSRKERIFVIVAE